MPWCKARSVKGRQSLSERRDRGEGGAGTNRLQLVLLAPTESVDEHIRQRTAEVDDLWKRLVSVRQAQGRQEGRKEATHLVPDEDEQGRCQNGLPHPDVVVRPSLLSPVELVKVLLVVVQTDCAWVGVSHGTSRRVGELVGRRKELLDVGEDGVEPGHAEPEAKES